MSLPLTSLIPTVIELVLFWEANWPNIFWYPYWYLGVPLRFLTGPVVPLLVILLRRLSNFSHLSIYLGLITISWITGSIGLYRLVISLGGDKKTARLASWLFLLIPLAVWQLQFSHGLGQLAFGFLPLLFYCGKRSQKYWRGVDILLCELILTLIFLIHPSAALTGGVGCLILALSDQPKNWLTNILRYIFIFFTAFGISTIWYTPAYWWTLLFNPSLAGKSLLKVIGFVSQFLVSLLPLVFGLWAVQKKFRLHAQLGRFAALFGGFFLFLTLVRLLSDVDFWIDWTAYILEIQMFLAMMIPLFIGKISSRYTQFITLFIILILTIFDVSFIKKLLINPTATKYKEEIIGQMALPDRENSRFFFSGSPVFWLNSKLIRPIMQVRGGKDQAAINSVWSTGAYQIREGVDENSKESGQPNGKELLNLWLQVFGVKYILVHQNYSVESFRDFKNRDRFSALQLVSEKEGNFLYKTNNTWARVADIKILTVSPPTAGNDGKSLTAYIQKYKRGVEAKFTHANQIIIDVPKLGKDEVISLSVTSKAGWQTDKGRLTADKWGHLVLILDEAGPVTLTYRESGWGSSWGILITLMAILGGKYYYMFGRSLEKMLGKLQLEDDEQENY